ncbi:MAG: hypothetical protein WBQ44_20125, partial [Rhodococcus sp. (in: high G+C Gram-positive bacteria)]
MTHMHPVLATLMLLCVVSATICCWAAGARVSRRARAGSVVMAGSMAVLLLPGGTAWALPVAALLLVVGMVGTVGRRGRASIREDAHRSVGALLMAVMVLQGASRGVASPALEGAPDHGMHQSTVAAEWGIPLAALLVLLAWT